MRPLTTRLAGRGLVVFAVAFVLLEIIESYLRPTTADGVHFQAWSSETLMQSVSVRELRAAPLETLWYLHVQPPLHNTIRAVFAGLHGERPWGDLVNDVDRDLYHVWALASAALAALVFVWLRRLGLPRALAEMLSLIWFLHPANLGYATLLDSTLLSALLTAWIIYEVWRLSRKPRGSLVPLGCAVLLAYFTRSLYQWPFVAVILGSLLLVKVPRRNLVAFGAVVVTVVGLYSLKQKLLFGTVATSTLRGTNLVNGIGAKCEPAAPTPPEPHARSSPAVLVLPQKTDGSTNFNHVDRLGTERELLACFRRTLAERPLTALWTAWKDNFEIYMRPSSAYWPNPIVDRAAWRRPFDDVFSRDKLLWISFVAALLTAGRMRRRPRAALAVLLPVAYVFAVSVTAEHGENMRFKFFLEPALYVWWAASAYFSARYFQRVWRLAREAPPSLLAARGG
jgi:hypothetical protein